MLSGAAVVTNDRYLKIRIYQTPWGHRFKLGFCGPRPTDVYGNVVKGVLA